MRLPTSSELEEKYSTIYNELLRQQSLLDALAKPKPTDPVAWTKQNRILKGKPFGFEDRDYLLPLYRDSSHRIIIHLLLDLGLERLQRSQKHSRRLRSH